MSRVYVGRSPDSLAVTAASGVAMEIKAASGSVIEIIEWCLGAIGAATPEAAFKVKLLESRHSSDATVSTGTTMPLVALKSGDPSTGAVAVVDASVGSAGTTSENLQSYSMSLRSGDVVYYPKGERPIITNGSLWRLSYSRFGTESFDVACYVIFKELAV